MKTLKSLVLIFCLLVASNAFSQKEIEAQKQIKTLKEGALLVRLKTSENKINALTKLGDKKGAEELKATQEKENREIANAFKENFTFCKVYFFYSNFSNYIGEDKTKGLLMNAELKPDDSFTGSNFLVGEFGESESNKVASFLIKDKKFEQLSKPFPFLTRQNKQLIVERSKPEIVILLNKNLDDFYKKK